MDMEFGLTTAEVAQLFLVRANTIRVSLCRCGHYLGIRPRKLGNRRLSWPKSEVLAAVTGSRGRYQRQK
jgi:hypothetical protein